MNNDFNSNIIDQKTQDVSKTFIAQVFSWMATALGISGLAAWFFSHDPTLLSLMVDETGISGFGKFISFAPLILVFVIGFTMQKGSYALNVGMFLLFSLAMGMSLSFIFMIYQLGSIITIFGASAGLFGLMAVLGYTTKTDLTKMGSLLMMALFGVIIASVINWFIGSETFGYITSCLVVVIFTGLTAYDMQKIKDLSAEVTPGSSIAMKLSLTAALTLYLDFINIFLALLRLFGRRN
ncbi:MAG: Bax inhibitor-1/YccA family protein [Bacteroidetes bacterium]|nr:Bax inhibitor-1/YccA family protein [Bacteroidota bacterium]